MKHKKIIYIMLFGLFFYLINLYLLMSFESENKGASINNFGDAVWYSIVTIASVGYGDKYPVTLYGKFIGGIFVLGSIFIFTVLIGEFSDYVSTVRERKKMGYNGINFMNHIIIIGWDQFAKSIVQILINSHNQIAVITDKKDDLDIINENFPQENFFVLYSDHDNYTLFEKANIHKARLLFVNLVNDTDKLVLILNLKRLYSNLQFMVSLNNPNLKETFESAGVTYLISKDEIASKLIASYIFEPEVANFNIDILSDSNHVDDYDVQQFKVTRSFLYVNQTIGEFADLIKSKNIRSLIVAINKFNDGKPVLIKIPDVSTIIEEGDYVIFINNGDSSKEISNLFNVKQGR